MSQTTSNAAALLQVRDVKTHFDIVAKGGFFGKSLPP